MWSRRPAARRRLPAGAAPAAPRRAARQRVTDGRSLSSRQAAILEVLDGQEGPVDAETLADAVRATGAAMPLSSLYRVLTGLVTAGLVVQLRASGRRRFLAGRRAVHYSIEDGEGRHIGLDVPGLRALLTVAAVEQGLPLTAHVTIRFSPK